MIVWMEMSSRTIIDYHAPFDRGLSPKSAISKSISYKIKVEASSIQ